jgi:hypothetical protein
VCCDLGQINSVLDGSIARNRRMNMARRVYERK